MPVKYRVAFLASLCCGWLSVSLTSVRDSPSDRESSQYARGMAEFNIVKHQPQPPGYLLWVLGARLLNSSAIGAMQSQILLAFLMTLAALAIFYRLALHVLQSQVTALTCTALLAYSPAVALNSSIPSPSVTDLVASLVTSFL